MIDLEPSRRERWLVYRCFLLEGIWLGDENEIWSIPEAYRGLATMRLVIDAIERVINANFELTEDTVKAVVMQTDDLGTVPYKLIEFAHFMLTNDGARHYWQTMMRDEKFPHTCDRCGSAAYIGLRLVECKARCR